ncbi:hypothetical protein Sste5346_006398 [Sporothrix stenoceras]|uniref:Glutamine amidotransferase type-2 domain-containing protein n=1 Tax=Sporothrix stenoceras TaxID=5173 RepID=A0ABR3YZ90_9PEZI
MCGIHAVIALKTATDDSSNGHDNGNTSTPIEPLSEVLHTRLARRGPDHFGQVNSSFAGQDGGKTADLRFTSTVLALRGDGLTPQPFEEPSTGRVLCWNGEVWRFDGAGDKHDEVDGNDGQQLFDRLKACVDTPGVLNVLRAIEGPFAFVYYDRPTGQLYYGRDRLGRRSLLERRTDDTLTLSSVSDVSPSSSSDNPWVEVEADGIYMVDLQQERPFASTSSDAPGGTTRYDWSDETVVDGDAIVSGLGRFNMDSVPPPDDARLTLDSPSVHQLREQLMASLRLRVQNVPLPPSTTSSNGHPSRVTRIAVLFSGGLDCTVLARMTHDLLPADQGVDLINVAFENPRVVSHLKGDVTDIYEACPDRITGRASYAELQRACPSRKWRFVAVNVPYTETVAHRPEIVALMHPHNTEMDLSIGTALYFASRAVSSTGETTETSAHHATSARVLLSGLGADELFGGYGRHTVAFSRDGGYSALASELLLDVARLGRRNLGRDDRVLAHWGREVRFPFLDERLVRWALALPVWAKCDFANTAGGDDGEPAKRVLRLVALSLGMPNVAKEKKRAIQFGARTAKMESGRVKGTALVA